MPGGVAGKQILLTGASGFIGRRLMNRFVAEEPAALVALARSPLQAPPAVHVVTSSLHELTADTWRRAGVDRFDLVLHLGGFTPKRTTDADRVEEICRDNVEGTRALLESLPAAPERILFASTLDVYAPALDGAPLSESSPVGPAGLYGASKLFCERMTQVMAKRLDCGSIILRYGHIFGPGEEAYAKLIPQMIRAMKQGRGPTLFGSGFALRDYLYVDDAVEATVRAAGADLSDGLPINIVRGESVPIRRVAEILCAVAGTGMTVQFERDRPEGVSMRFDNARMRSLLGEWPFVTLEEGLNREYESFALGADAS